MHALLDRLPLLIEHRSGWTSTAIVVRVEAGFGHEQPNERGAAHLLEHLVFEGSRAFPRSGELQARCEAAGGYSSGMTGAYHTEYSFRVPPHAAVPTLNRLIDAVTAPLFDLDTIARERAILAREQGIDQPDSLVCALEHICQQLGWATYQLDPNLSAAALQQFFMRCYQPEYMCVSIVGHVPAALRAPRLVSRACERAIPPTPAGRAHKRRSPVRLAGPNADDLVVVAFPCPPVATLRDYGGLNLLSALVAGRASAQLPRRLREQGLCYEVSSVVQHHSVGSLFVLVAGAAPGTGEALVEIVLNWWADRAAHGFSARELRAALSYYRGTTAMHLEHPRHAAVYRCETYALLRQPVDFTDELAALRDNTPDIVHDVLSIFRAEQAMSIVIGGAS